jgi:hypothetical protein
MVRFGSSTEVRYGALIGDVVQSRASPDRGNLQRRVLQEIEKLSASLEDALPLPLGLTSGDEIQGLFREPAEAVTVAVALTEAILPERWVFGLGYGTLSTDLYDNVARIDGPCFHRAREALRRTRAGGWLTALGFGEPEDRAVSSLFTLMDAVRGRWTEKQLGYVRAARWWPQKDVARDFGVSPSTVSESLKAASFAAVQEGERAARQLLARFGSDGESRACSGKEPN